MESKVTLKTLITTIITPASIVYERIYSESLPQQKRDSYFLTETYDIREMVNARNSDEDVFELRYKTEGSPSKKYNKQTFNPYYRPTSESDQTLVFESRFESGNLCMAIKVIHNIK